MQLLIWGLCLLGVEITYKINKLKKKKACLCCKCGFRTLFFQPNSHWWPKLCLCQFAVTQGCVAEAEDLTHRFRNNDFRKWETPPCCPKAYKSMVEVRANAISILNAFPGMLPASPLCWAAVMRQVFHVSEHAVQQRPVHEGKGLLLFVQVWIPANITGS